MLNDKTLQAMVREELDWTPEIDAAGIGVSAHGGVVTLTGIVSTLAEKHAAERAVRRVRGVRALAQEIMVHVPDSHKTSDAEIAGRALRILSWDVHVPHDHIQVIVENGIVTLTGAVSHSFQKRAAVRDVRQLGGVAGINDAILVIRPLCALTDRSVVHHQIENAMRRNAEIEASHISVSVMDGKVILRGKVKTWRDREIAEMAAWAAPSVKEVDDQLTINA